ncbi:GGDEF domain-containing protein [Peristeroidobacter agariperforans]|uniref:GGDEF domain-containing protein n=1 Tax=Peristeroidobacter agariperforans TaxID=268404 RepID=UPI00101D570F|nr:GGDEF domain-containing protein [Peristeroidobacter agariperforans]
MRSAQPAAAQTQGFAARALLCLELLTLAIGALQFAFVPDSVERPLLAATALGLLTVSILFSRVVPAFQRPIARQHCIDIAALIVCITLFAVATGSAHSFLVPLYLIPLVGASLAFGRWWVVLLLTTVIAAVGFLLGALTPQMDIAGPEFGVQLLSVLAPGAAVALIIAALIEQMNSAVQRISDLASTDALTGLLNLRSFEEILQQEHRKAERFGRPYTIVVVDVDNLAHINETMGHEAGSQILGAVAAAITRSIRTSDVAARLGGDEFVVLLTEADTAMGGAIATRIRNNVYAGTVSVANRLIRANVNVGTANFPEDHLYPKELMILADQNMQQDRALRRPPE